MNLQRINFWFFFTLMRERFGELSLYSWHVTQDGASIGIRIAVETDGNQKRSVNKEAIDL